MCWCGELFEERGSGFVYADVGGLGGEDGCDEEFVGIFIVEFAMGIGVGVLEVLVEFEGALFLGGGFAGECLCFFGHVEFS